MVVRLFGERKKQNKGFTQRNLREQKKQNKGFTQRNLTEQKKQKGLRVKQK